MILLRQTLSINMLGLFRWKQNIQIRKRTIRYRKKNQHHNHQGNTKQKNHTKSHKKKLPQKTRCQTICCGKVSFSCLIGDSCRHVLILKQRFLSSYWTQISSNQLRQTRPFHLYIAILSVQAKLKVPQGVTSIPNSKKDGKYKGSTKRTKRQTMICKTWHRN